MCRNELKRQPVNVQSFLLFTDRSGKGCSDKPYSYQVGTAFECIYCAEMYIRSIYGT